jgi:hypothetical protein
VTSKKTPKASPPRLRQDTLGAIPLVIMSDINPLRSCRLDETSKLRRFLETTGFSKKLKLRELD